MTESKKLSSDEIAKAREIAEAKTRAMHPDRDDIRVVGVAEEADNEGVVKTLTIAFKETETNTK